MSFRQIWLSHPAHPQKLARMSMFINTWVIHWVVHQDTVILFRAMGGSACIARTIVWYWCTRWRRFDGHIECRLKHVTQINSNHYQLACKITSFSYVPINHSAKLKVNATPRIVCFQSLLLVLLHSKPDNSLRSSQVQGQCNVTK